MHVKICGVTMLDDALAAARAGADMLGLNFYRKSPRWIEPQAARLLAAGLRRELGAACPLLVGVFVNEPVERIAELVERVGLDAAQLSGDEPGDDLRALAGIAFKAIRPRTLEEARAAADAYLPFAPRDERIPALLLDAHRPGQYGGTGESAPPDTARALIGLTPRLMLAGGLTPDNVAARVREVRPWGVDTASGVENGTPGRKDRALVCAFVRAARQAGGG